ncbi:DUF2628 domain-containing protein [Stappia sp. F7233]|uniref:DUF2628 domain-containing protein n=1 Tax=Stappia albiluteola TaxID=2758565 RepID=A0A839AIW4_9HYPH|nr:DUF2628 domain-containing protein [Stappia albiluteola]MBA5778864.1 DUF2628 domain-containing protein [Stappia albiluteola]
MTIFAALIPPEANPSRLSIRDADRTVFIKDGFSWPALLLPIIWLLWHRLWLVLLGYLAAAVALEAITMTLGGPWAAISGLAFSFLFALEANNLRRWTLEKRGWTFAAAIAGADKDEAEARFFSAHAASLPAKGSPPAPQPGQTRPGGPVPRIGTESVVGLTLGREGA